MLMSAGKFHLSKVIKKAIQTKYPTFVCLSLATPLHHLHTHPLLLQHLLISPLSHLLLDLKSSRFCLTVLTNNLIVIISTQPIKKIGLKICLNIGESRVTSFLYQCISVLVQRLNAILLLNSLPTVDCAD